MSLGAFDGIMQYMFAASRPFWVSDQIVGLKCVTTFGNPDNHVMVITGLTTTLWLMWIYPNEQIDEKAD